MPNSSNESYRFGFSALGGANSCCDLLSSRCCLDFSCMYSAGKKGKLIFDYIAEDMQSLKGATKTLEFKQKQLRDIMLKQYLT